jgi:signal transduction histidine kinase
MLALQAQAVDVALAAGLTVVNIAFLIPYRSQLHPFGVAVVLVAAQSVPLAFRRARPPAVLLIVGGARIAYDLAGFGHAPFPLGPAIAVYTVADRCSPRARAWLLGALVAGILVSQFGSPHDQPYDLAVAALIFLTAWVAGIASRTRRAYLAAVEQRARTAESDRDREAAQAAGAERSRIARELHDVVAHHVSLIAVQAEAASSVLAERPALAAGSIEVISATARETLTELRHLLGVLRSSDEPVEVAPAASLAQLGALLDRITETGLSTELAVRGTPRRLPDAVDVTAYRIIQEALTNVVRHSAASRAQVTLTYDPSHVEVTVVDSGDNRAGPPARRDQGALVSSGFGLAGIAERVASCGGNLRLGPTPAGRFCVSADLPT